MQHLAITKGSETMITLNVKQVMEKNTKGINVAVVDDSGVTVAALRSTDLNQFLADQTRLNREPAQFQSYDNYFKVEFRVKKRLLKGSVIYQTCTLGYSPDGMDLTGRSENTYVNKHGFFLTNSYDKPEAIKLLDDSMVLDTNLGRFKIELVGDHYKATKV